MKSLERQNNVTIGLKCQQLYKNVLPHSVCLIHVCKVKIWAPLKLLTSKCNFNVPKLGQPKLECVSKTNHPVWTLVVEKNVLLSASSFSTVDSLRCRKKIILKRLSLLGLVLVTVGALFWIAGLLSVYLTNTFSGKQISSPNLLCDAKNYLYFQHPNQFLWKEIRLFSHIAVKFILPHPTVSPILC